MTGDKKGEIDPDKLLIRLVLGAGTSECIDVPLNADEEPWSKRITIDVIYSIKPRAQEIRYSIPRETLKNLRDYLNQINLG